MVKIWIDDIRPKPKGYDISINSVYEFMLLFTKWGLCDTVDHDVLIDLDHDSGEYSCDGGDYIKILEWLDFLKNRFNGYMINYFTLHFRIHSGNVVGRENMRRIIESNGWDFIED